MSDLERERREAQRELNKPGDRPDPSLKITRRTFLHKSIGGRGGDRRGRPTDGFR